jgi:SAM-dependent methyltransferase
MRRSHLHLLVCPDCREPLDLRSEDVGERVRTGTLSCARCRAEYAIHDHIPRFVPKDNYASSFGFEWSRHAVTQHDGHTGLKISETRFFEETGWPRDLTGETILEVGCGSGRFTEQALKTGAMVVSLDYSVAVDAAFKSFGARDNLLIVQADLYRLPFPERAFDRLFCFGVLQHTPNVHKAFLALPRVVRRGGHIVVDVYRRYGPIKQLLNTRYWVRPLTRRIARERLHAFCTAYVRMMWPLTRVLHKVPRLGRGIVSALLIPDYQGVLDLPEPTRREWAELDLFDMLSPVYDQPQPVQALRKWFEEAGLEAIDVRPGYNGVQGRAVIA